MKTILLIDDSAMLRMTFGEALREAGYNVIEAESGVAGLALARQHLPDLILSDIQMPGGSGTTLLREIRQDPVLRARQLVLMTGRPDLVTPRKGMEDGADDFLVKPVKLEALLKCVEARLKRASVSWRVEDERLAQLRSLVPPQLPHEIFTPMAGIIGLTEILRADITELTPVEVTDILNDLHQSGLRLNRTLRNYLLILDFQTVAHETLFGSMSPRQVEECIQAGVREALQLNKRQEDVTVQVSPCSLAVKPESLNRIVEELVDNACKFSREGTSVQVELSPDGRLTITDYGRGLTKEDILHVGAFQQFDRRKREQQGLGLGLVLVQKLAELNQAKISITSTLGEGTQVEVALPLANGIEDPGEKADAAAR
jgi:signal transduction histidine kinase